MGEEEGGGETLGSEFGSAGADLIRGVRRMVAAARRASLKRSNVQMPVSGDGGHCGRMIWRRSWMASSLALMSAALKCSARRAGSFGSSE